MSTVGRLQALLSLNTSDFNTKLDAARRKMRKFKDETAKFSDKIHSSGTGMSNWANKTGEAYEAAAKSLNKHNLQLKDTIRIVHGIVIAQTFYQAAGAITDAARALWDFNVALDYMHVTYSALFGDSERASNFMSALQEHSIETIFDYQTLADASKKLLAYGIEYENLMYIMEGLTNLGAMSGDTAALDRIALALGQIYTKGKLSAEEMRQLANAYIPITAILQDKFGLTGDDLKRVGDLNLPAADVINAIVEYANENFASVGDAAMYTITGLQNRIVDTLKVVGSEMLKPVTAAYKSFLVYIARGLEDLRASFNEGGLGGVFEHLVPDKSTQQKIRQFIANVKNLLMALASVAVAAGNAFSHVVSVAVTAFNILSPLVTGFINVLAAFVNALLETSTGAAILRIALVAAAGAFAILKIQAVGALIITAVTKAVIGLAKALVLLAAIVSKHPILALLAGITLALIAASGASEKFNEAISGLFDGLSDALGSSSDDVLQKTEQDLEDGAGAADEFGNALDGAAGSAENLEDAISGAGKEAKKTKGLLSFDEVYKLPTPTEGSDTGGFGDGLIGSLNDLVDVFEGLGDGLIPEIPDFSEFINGFTDNLFGGLKDGIMARMGDAGIGALIGGGLGAIIGGLLGGPGGAKIGAAIGALAGGIVGWFWEDLKEAFSGTYTFIGGGLGAVLGAVLGGLLGGPGGAKIGAAIGALAGGIVGWFWEDLKEAFSGSNTFIGGLSGIGSVIAGALAKLPITIGSGTFTGWFSSIAAAFKNAGLKNIAKGGLIGAAIGFVVDLIASFLWRHLAERFELGDTALQTAKVGQTIGSVIGAVFGGIIGGPGGAIIGSAIGTFVGGLTGLFWEKILPAVSEWGSGVIDAFTAPFIEWGQGIYTFWTDHIIMPFKEAIANSEGSWLEIGANILLGILKGILGVIATIGTFIVTVFTAIKDAFCAIFGIHSPATAMEPIGENILLGVLAGMINTIPQVIEGILPFGTQLVETIAGFFTEMGTDVAEWATNSMSKVREFANNAGSSISTFASNASNRISSFTTNAITKIKNWATNTATAASNAMSKFKTAVSNGVSNVLSKISGFCSNALSKIRTWASNVATAVSNAWQKVLDFISRAKSSLSSAGSRVSASFSLGGHASGGVFNREHIARFAEGNKAEAIIPLEEKSAMQPFVDAVANGLTQSLAPMLATAGGGSAPAYGYGGNDALPPMYVGTLIADERGLKELERRMRVIRVKEEKRGNR